MGPQVSFLYASYGQHLSLRDSVKSRRLIESPFYKKNWADRYSMADGMDTKTRFDNSEGGYRIATSVGGALTGEGAEIICVDDAHNAVEMESKVTREGVIEWWTTSMSTRLNDPKTGSFIVVMQRLHEEDLAGHIIAHNEGEWTHLCLPMRFEPKRFCFTSLGWGDPRGLDDGGDELEGLEMDATPPRVVPGTPMAEADGALLWPERFGEEEVANLERALGPYGSAGQLQQSPSPKGGGILKDKWWRMFPQKGEEQLYLRNVTRWDEQRGENVEREILSYPEMEYVVAYADTAYTEKEENDYSACAVFGVWRDAQDNARLMMMRCWQERLELHKLVQKLVATCVLTGKYGEKNAVYVDRLVIENKASGKSVAQEIIRLFGNEKWSTLVDDVRGDKVARAYSVQYLFADGMVFAPGREWADKAIAECASFPKGAHDDLVDAIVGSISYIRRNGYIEMRRERRIAEEEAVAFKGNVKGALYDV